MDNHSAVNNRRLNFNTYKEEASNAEEECHSFHRTVSYRNSPENKVESLGQKKVSNDTLDQRSSAFLEASFDSGIESLSTISDERQSKSTGEFYFANDPLSKQCIIDQLRSEQSNLYCIRSLEDFDKHCLIQEVWLKDGRLRQEEGRLFIDKPLTLIFDLTAMTPGDIASFNDMLQVKPRCNDKPLGDHVKRVFLVNDAMINGGQIANPDLWRRLGQMSQKEIPDADGVPDSITDETLLAQKTTEEIPASKPQKIIDFFGSDEWYFLLFGGITMNEQGTFIVSEGALAHLGDDAHLVLKNAPWNSTGFKESIVEALRAGGFEVNRQWVGLSDNITFSREDVSTSELDNLKSKLLTKTETFKSKNQFVCINANSIESLQCRIRIEGNLVVKADMLATLLNGSKQLVITSEMEEKQWLWLFAKLDTLPEAVKPSLFIHLPPALLLSSEAMKRHNDEALSLLREGNDPFIYEISSSDTLDSFQQVRLNSQNHFTFSLINSPLMECLVHGTPVILGGFGCNLTLAASLETLLLPNPYLFIHGNKVDLPNANVTLIKSVKGETTSSPLINKILNSIDSQKESLSENPIYSLLKLLPHAYQKMLPWRSDTFQYQFERQAEAERLLDGSNEITPYHKCCALHVILAKSYRGNSVVYSFIKAKIAHYYPDTVTNNRSDRSALQQWLAKYSISEITMEKIKEDFWALVRHCSVDVHEAINDINDIGEASLNNLATHLVGAADQYLQVTLAYQLKVDLQLAREKSFFNGVMRSTLRDALVANKALLKLGTVISETVALLEQEVSLILTKHSTDQDKLQSIKEILASYFQNGQLPKDYQNLPNALISNQRHTHAREQRRLARLANLIQLHPIVFLQGEAGAGKTFMAKAVADKAGYSGFKVIKIDPIQTLDELFGGQQLKRYTVDNKTDHCSEFHQGSLLEWASSDNPELLLLDEANMASEGLLSSLIGLTRARPELHYQGHQYPLMKTHRIIMTGNPEHYVGRHLDKALQSRIPILFYPPLQESVLADSIILPNLSNWPAVQKQQACDRIIILFNLFKKLVRGDLMTPRDINDVLATVHQILRYYSEPLDNLTEEQINALIRRAFMDSLAGAVTEDYQKRLNSLNGWYQGRYLEDLSVMTNMDQAFDTFVEQLQEENSDADFSPAPVRQLVYHYWQNLDKGEGGRVALLVEGSTGWGKDFVLSKTIKLWQKQQQALKSLPDKPFVHINANPSQWSFQVERVEEAKRDGKPVIISEFNLITSHYQEGLLNDVLTSPAKQGFRLFATINPSSFEGREVLSPALKSRCTQVKLRPISQLAMEGLVHRLPNMPQGLPQWLSGYFHQLSTALDDQKSAVRLTLDDLFSSAKDLANKDADQWEEAFQQHLPLQFHALNRNIFLPRLEEERAHFSLKHAQEQHRLACEKAIHNLPGLLAPITVTFCDLFRVDGRDVTVKPDTTAKQAARDVQLVLQNRSQINDDKTVKRRSVATRVERLGKGRSCVFSAINTIPHFEVTCYFPKEPYSSDDYRLSLQEVHLDEDGQFRVYPIDWQNGGSFADVAGWPDSIDWREDYRTDELLGHIVLTLNDQWQSLPSLTPADQLRAIRCIPKTNIQLARCQTTGLLLIKQQGSKSNKVTIDFIIAPEQRYFTQINVEDSLIIQENLCCQRLRRLLDENIFNASGDTCDAYQELRTIHQIYHIPQRLNALMYWLDTFTSDKNITGKNKGEGMFLNLLKQKRGVCSHKSCIFENLCRYWGLSARQVQNVGHVFVEVSPDGGDTWRQYQLGGGGKYTETAVDEHWDEYHPPVTSELSPTVRRAPLANSEFSQEGAGETKGEKCKPDNIDKGLSLDDLIREIKKTFIQGQPLSDTRLRQLKTYLEQTLMNVESNKNVFINGLINAIERSFSTIDDSTFHYNYIDCICYFCEINDAIKNEALGFLQREVSSHSSCKYRVQKMIEDLPLFVNKMIFKTANEDKSALACFVRTLPNSNYLERKLAQVKIDRTYTRVPKGNCSLSLERMVTGLPSFINQSTLKTSKSIIIDLHDVRIEIRRRIYQYFTLRQDKKTKFWMWVQKEKRFTDTASSVVKLLHIFLIWMAKQKPEDNSVWRWLTDQYTTCYEQTSPMQTPTIYYMKDWRLCGVDIPSELIRAQMNEPSVVILKCDDIVEILNDFLYERSDRV
ncbi:MAG: AAA family ATPase [Endozoicomonadaceae bacterium]|nr:AAA family ATPase [Endozoicomonadaceae bacterium]